MSPWPWPLTTRLNNFCIIQLLSYAKLFIFKSSIFISCMYMYWNSILLHIMMRSQWPWYKSCMIQKLFNLVVKGQGHGDIMSVIKLVDTLQICIPCNLIQLLTFVEVNICICIETAYFCILWWGHSDLDLRNQGEISL
jgi:hypothetical protein